MDATVQADHQLKVKKSEKIYAPGKITEIIAESERCRIVSRLLNAGNILEQGPK